MNEDVKARALALLATGKSYRRVQKALQEELAQSISLSTLHSWQHEDPSRVAALASQQLALLAEQRVRIAHKAADHLEEIIDEGRVSRPEIVYGIAQDKVDSMLRISQDERRQDKLAAAIRHALTLPDEEIDAIVEQSLLSN